MARSFTIVGVGEALLVERAESREAAGLASLVAVHAVRLGHVGVVVSRIGQDDPARELLRRLEEAGVDTSHVQSDPDLPTGRVIERAVGPPVARYLDSPAAFDNLQADFDLDDIAQQADAVVFGLLTRRSGQTRSEENRFLEACAAAIKVMDLTGAAANAERGHALSGLEIADAAVVDRASLALLEPGSASQPLADAARALQKWADLAFIIAVEEAGDENADGRSLIAHNADARAAATIPAGRDAQVAATLGVLDTLLRGRGIEPAVALGARVAAHAVENPREHVPSEWLTSRE